MDITTLIARMGDVRLMDLDDGELILKKLTDAVGGDDKVFTIEMTGNQIKDKYIALPSSVRAGIDVIAILDQAQWMNMLNDIKRITDNRQVIAQKDDAVIEAYLTVVIVMIVFSIAIAVGLYHMSTLDIKGSQSGLVRIVLEHAVVNIAKAELGDGSSTTNTSTEQSQPPPEQEIPTSGS